MALFSNSRSGWLYAILLIVILMPLAAVLYMNPPHPEFGALSIHPFCYRSGGRGTSRLVS